MARLRQNFLGGELTAAVDDAANIIQSPALSTAPVVVAPDTMTIIIDPDGAGRKGNAPEIVEIIEHSADSISAMVVRGAQGTTARAHQYGTPWVHAITALEWNELEQPPTMEALGRTIYNPAAEVLAVAPTTTNDPVAIDSTNVRVDFVVPPSGEVDVYVEAAVNTSGNARLDWALVNAAGVLLSDVRTMAYTSDDDIARPSTVFALTGLTPGTAISARLAHRKNAGSAWTRYGGTIGPVTLEARDRNVGRTTAAKPTYIGEGLVLLAEAPRLEADQATLDLTGIPGGFRDLVLTGRVRSTRAAVTDPLQLLLGTSGTIDVGTSYVYGCNSFGSHGWNGQSAGAGFIYLSPYSMPGATGEAGAFALFEIVIHDYTSTTFAKEVEATVRGRASTTYYNNASTTGRWLNTTGAVDCVRIKPEVGPLLAAGSAIQAWGRGAL